MRSRLHEGVSLRSIGYSVENVWTAQSDQQSKKWSRKSERLTGRVRAYYYCHSLYIMLSQEIR